MGKERKTFKRFLIIENSTKKVQHYCLSCAIYLGLVEETIWRQEVQSRLMHSAKECFHHLARRLLTFNVFLFNITAKT